jgi:hypothetical protein
MKPSLLAFQTGAFAEKNQEGVILQVWNVATSTCSVTAPYPGVADVATYILNDNVAPSLECSNSQLHYCVLPGR